MSHFIQRLALTVVAGLLIASAPIAAAQDPVLSRVLVPVWVENPIPGANGSIWTTNLSVLYHGSRPATLIEGFDSECISSPCPLSPPGITFMPRFTWVGDGGVAPTRFLFVLTEDLPDLSFALRVAEQSRLASTWGFTIPVVTEQEAFTGPVNLLDLPTEGDFRTMLRVYDFDPETHASTPAAVRVRLYAHNPTVKVAGSHFGTKPQDSLLFERDYTFRYAPEHRLDVTPGYLEVPAIERLAPLPAGMRLRIEVSPITPGLRFWAFASVTHNETQQITVALP